MEDNQPATRKYALIYGAISGAIGIALALILYSQGLQHQQGLGIQAIQFTILATMIVVAVYQFKQANSGYLAIIDAVKIAPGVAVISFIIGILWFLLFSNVIEPDFVAETMAIGKQKAMEQNPELTGEQLDKGMEMQQNFFWVIMGVFLLISAVLAAIVGLIVGLIMKKEKPAY